MIWKKGAGHPGPGVVRTQIAVTSFCR